MKTAYVADLTPDQSITSFFLVCEKEVRSTRDGKAYLRLELGRPHRNRRGAHVGSLRRVRCFHFPR